MTTIMVVRVKIASRKTTTKKTTPTLPVCANVMNGVVKMFGNSFTSCITQRETHIFTYYHMILFSFPQLAHIPLFTAITTMTTTWPLEMSRLILDYAGPFNFWTQEEMDNAHYNEMYQEFLDLQKMKEIQDAENEGDDEVDRWLEEEEARIYSF